MLMAEYDEIAGALLDGVVTSLGGGSEAFLSQNLMTVARTLTGRRGKTAFKKLAVIHRNRQGMGIMVREFLIDEATDAACPPRSAGVQIQSATINGVWR